MRTKLFVLLFVFLLLLSACKKDENSSERDNIQSETTSEEALNSGTQQAKEATGTQQVDNSKNRPALQQVDNKNIEHNLLLTYNLEEPTSSNTASADSHLKIIFASDDANPALKSEYRDKELGKLVTISPKIDGKWFGSKSGKNIVFKPTEEWSANTKYTVTMDKTLFNTKYKVNKLSDSFTFLGYDTNPYKYVSKSDLFVCSSLREGFSTAATEALIVGTPVCTVEVSGMKEMLGKNNEYGVITENNEDALFEGIKELLDSPDTLAHYREKAEERGRSFSTDVTVKAVEKMLEELCE